jgi:predicted nucleotidyltransferase
VRLSARTKFLFAGDTCVERRITKGSLSDRKFNYNSVRVFERFYYHLGGDKIIPKRIAMKKFSEHYRGLARRHYSEKHRKAAVELYKKAISCCPYCLKNYRGLLKAVFLKSEDDKMPDWRMPEPLLAYVKVSDEKAFIENNCTIQNNCG